MAKMHWFFIMGWGGCCLFVFHSVLPLQFQHLDAVCMKSMGLSTKIVKFMTLGPGIQTPKWGPNGYIMKMHLKFRHHLYFCVLLKNTLCMIIKIMGPSTNIEKFLTPAASGFQALRQKWVCKWVVIDFI